MNAYETVKAARSGLRPTSLDYINGVFDDFIELHGDRLGGDDRAVIAGIAKLDKLTVTVIALEKGHDVAERVQRNFGAANPEGYRKALRHMKLAEKFHRPVVCLIDTSGAFCGIDAERNGQSRAIAECIAESATLKTPMISVVVGEGGSGGALALASGDELWMIAGAYYSVISPESCANILWKDASKASEAAENLHLTAGDMLKFKVADRIIGADLISDAGIFDEGMKSALFAELKYQLVCELGILSERTDAQLIEGRRRRFAL